MSFSAPTQSTSNRASTQASTGPTVSSLPAFPNMEERYDTVGNLAKRTLNIELPDTHPTANRALFVFSENNLIRKAARSIIEWGYPFL
ncbi:unnamed protein product [Echinostoma caproni]|uniref:Uncharacterized protein n=1 Tax=Echinostoma caproni TaxID=27848 RepID=A0A183AAQ6_9TREM|nr:unnamed protein product [Echinostoma caproni]